MTMPKMKFLPLLSLFWSIATAQTLIPGSTGPYAVAIQDQVFIDESRWDANAPEDDPHRRRFITSLFLPLEPDSCEPTVVPYLSPSAEAVWGAVASSQFGVPSDIIIGYEIEYCMPSANATRSDVAFPVVIFGPGLSSTRQMYAVQARELASHGYFVITVDYPYETFYVEFPDGSSVFGVPSNENDNKGAAWSQIRSDDVLYVLDNLDDVVSDLPIKVDTSKILQYGHSLGGNTAALTALRDSRVLGALNLDGAISGPVLEEGLDTPYVFVSNSAINYTSGEMWGSFHGPKFWGVLDNTTHVSFMDLAVLFATRGIPPETTEELLGKIQGLRMIEVVTSLVRAFGNYVFQGNPGDLKSIGDVYEDLEVHEDSIPAACSRSTT